MSSISLTFWFSMSAFSLIHSYHMFQKIFHPVLFDAYQLRYFSLKYMLNNLFHFWDIHCICLFWSNLSLHMLIVTTDFSKLFKVQIQFNHIFINWKLDFKIHNLNKKVTHKMIYKVQHNTTFWWLFLYDIWG